MKKIFTFSFVFLFFPTHLLALKIKMALNTHLKCDMFEREYNHSNDLRYDRTFEIESLADKTIFIAFDKNFVFYSWHKKKKTYEMKDKIIEYSELTIITEGQTYNFDTYLNYKEWYNSLGTSENIEGIPNPGSRVFKIDREEGQLVRYNIWRNGGGYIEKFKCKKINYFSLPKEKVNKKF